MPSPSENRRALRLVTTAAVAASVDLLTGLDGGPNAVRAGLLDGVPDIIAYYSLGSAALAADFYDDERERAGARGRFLAEPVVLDRSEKIRRAVAWASEPMFDDTLTVTPESRLAEVVQLETARPNRDTILENRRRDPQSTGWRRVTSGVGCKFCRMLAARGAVYREDTARFASHPNCSCTAWPVFRSNDDGVSADVLQYTASKRKRSPEESARIRDYLTKNFPDAPG